MKKLTLVISLALMLLLTGCMKDEIELVDNYNNFIEDLVLGKDVDLETECTKLYASDNVDRCVNTYLPIADTPYKSVEYNVQEIRQKQLSEDEKEELGFTMYDDVYEITFDYTTTLEYLVTEEETTTSSWTTELYAIIENGEYKLIFYLYEE